MFFPAGILHEQIISAGIPISGLRIGVVDDRSTWRPDFLPEATAEQRAQATTIIQTFDIDQAQQQEANRTLLQNSDAKMARVVEDLIDHLADKGVLDLQALPPAVRDLLTMRKNARSRI